MDESNSGHSEESQVSHLRSRKDRGENTQTFTTELAPGGSFINGSGFELSLLLFIWVLLSSKQILKLPSIWLCGCICTWVHVCECTVCLCV